VLCSLLPQAGEGSKFSSLIFFIINNSVEGKMVDVDFAIELTDKEIADRLKRSILGVLRLDVSLDTINNETNLYELGLDSLNVVALLTDMETLFDITIDVEDLSAELFEKFSNVVFFVSRRLNERG